MQKDHDIKQISVRLIRICKLGGVVKKWKKQAANSKDRYNRLRQLVETQNTYRNDLSLILNKIQKPLVDQSIITLDEAHQLFPEVISLRDLSKQIYQSMNVKLQTWDCHTTQFAAEMIGYSKFIILYSTYFTMYNTNIKKILGLLEKDQRVKNIQNAITQPPRIQTFDNLLSKPFQRPLKYHLLLKDYLTKLYKSHPDYNKTKEAIQHFHQINQKNNLALQNKQKQNILLFLQQKFGQIISTGARYFRIQTVAAVMDWKVKVYLFSDMLFVIKIQNKQQTELYRVLLDEQSFVEGPNDTIYFKNRIIICGTKTCIHLTFEERKERDLVLQAISEQINNLYTNDYSRKQIAGRRSTFTKQILTRRSSFTQKNIILNKPPRIFVLGQVKRRYSEKVSKIYYLIKYQLPYPQSSHQILYVEESDLLNFETLMRGVYKSQLSSVPIIEQTSKLLNNYESKNHQIKSLQFKLIYSGIFLNSLFRNLQIAKRTDIIAHFLGLSQGLWLYHRFGQINCTCSFCNEGKVITSIYNFEDELAMRTENKNNPNKIYCPIRTTNTLNAIAMVDSSTLVTTQERLFWLRCQKGTMLYNLYDQASLQFSKSSKIFIYINKLDSAAQFQYNLQKSNRVGHVIQSIERAYKNSFHDFQLFMEIDNNSFMLGRDQILSKVLKNQQPQQQGISGFFKNVFNRKTDYTIKLCLKKVWFLEYQYECSNISKPNFNYKYTVLQRIQRLVNEQISFNVNDKITFIAVCFTLLNIYDPHQMTLKELEKYVPQNIWQAMNNPKKLEMVKIIKEKYQKLKENIANKTDAGLQVLWQLFAKIGNKNSGMNCLMFDGLLMNYSGYDNYTPVKVGVDLGKFYIKAKGKITSIIDYQFGYIINRMLVSSTVMYLKDEYREYHIIGNSFQQLQEIMETYQQYLTKCKVNPRVRSYKSMKPQ